MFSRREFLRRSFLFALSSALAACSPNATPTANAPTATAQPTLTTPPLATSTRAATATRAPTASPTMTATPVSPSAGEPYLIVARGPSPSAITRAAIDAIGGMSKFVEPGNDVILKPNICNAHNTFEYASTTNPEVLATLVKLCLEAGAKRVRVMDQPFSGTAAEAYKVSGIREAVEKAGGQMEVMSSAKFVVAEFKGRNIKSWHVYQDILKADVVINVPIAKHHGSAQVTLAMKGLMGVINNRNDIHTALDQRIADLSTTIKPTLNVIDAVRVLTRNGPTGGRLDYVMQANTIIVSHDPVAADGYATQLFFSKKPESIGYIKIGAEMGLGRYDFGNLRIKEVTA
ncbi:MAG: DUF362 domain-containing protein [Chloroflexi bacterium]|nr:DUF362 domain-containing protein [Chloroflexota bacterium]